MVLCSVLTEWVSALADLVLEQHCAGCGGLDGPLCAACREVVDRGPWRCPARFGCPPVWAAGAYTGRGRAVLLAFKNGGYRHWRNLVPGLAAAVRAAAPTAERISLVPCRGGARGAEARLRPGADGGRGRSSAVARPGWRRGGLPAAVQPPDPGPGGAGRGRTVGEPVRGYAGPVARQESRGGGRGRGGRRRAHHGGHAGGGGSRAHCGGDPGCGRGRSGGTPLPRRDGPVANSDSWSGPFASRWCTARDVSGDSEKSLEDGT